MKNDLKKTLFWCISNQKHYEKQPLPDSRTPTKIKSGARTMCMQPCLHSTIDVSWLLDIKFINLRAIYQIY
jgi:hypothetical protein